jgi:hypothetical protein
MVAGAMLAVVTAMTAGAMAQEAPLSAPSAGRGPTHGQYIAESVAMCVQCHSQRDGAGNLMPAEQYLGGSIPFRSPFEGSEWALRAPRIAGLPGYTRDQGIRLLTQGLDRNNARLRPPMPQFRMTTEDAEDVVDFLLSRQ